MNWCSVRTALGVPESLAVSQVSFLISILLHDAVKDRPTQWTGGVFVAALSERETTRARTALVRGSGEKRLKLFRIHSRHIDSGKIGSLCAEPHSRC